MEADCIGIVRVPLTLLSFNLPASVKAPASKNWHPQEQLLRLDLKKIHRLSRSFRLGRCRPSRPEHQMRGIVTPETLETIRKATKLSEQELFETSAVGKFPYVTGSFTIWCLQGRRRAIAAKLAFHDKAWWTVRLYCGAAGPDRVISLLDDIESLCNDASDGTIYRQVRISINKGEHGEVRRCVLKLSPPKRKNVFQLLRRTDVAKALDLLWPLTGLWDGLQLGNIHKHFALHCDPQIIAFVGHIRQVWSQIFQGHNNLEGLLDIETVHFLQFRSPGACKQDEEEIRRAMGLGQLFFLITNRAVRQDLLQNVLSIRGVIPSIRTFHENMKYFSISAQILQKHVEVAKFVEVTAGSRKRQRVDLMTSLCSDWKRPTESCIEIREGAFHPIQIFMTPQLAFIEMFIRAQRNFARLSANAPLQGKQDKKVVAYEDRSCVESFCDMARKAGFMNEKLAHEKSTTQSPNHTTGKTPSLDRAAYATLPAGSNSQIPDTSMPADWRGGKPF
ncbi:hypothetical protein BKA67DRAFT_602135, partial [Truncatella angustata]